MTQAPVLVTNADLLDNLVGIHSGAPPGAIRNKRADIARYIEASYNALLTPDDPAGLSLLERALIAYRVTVLARSAPLTEHYRAHLRQLGAPVATINAAERVMLLEPLAPRTIALLKHVDLLTNKPHAATPAHIAALQAQGLRAPDIVTLAQLIAFLSFQVRALAGFQLLAEDA